MNPMMTVLAALGLFCILFFTFCFGMVYQGQLIEKAAKNGQPCKLPGGLIVRVERWNGGQP